MDVAVLDIGILVFESLSSLSLAFGLRENGNFTEYTLIIVFLALPGILNGLTWLVMTSKYPSFKTLPVFLRLILGFPSPILMYIWHLYLKIFGGTSKEIRESRILSDVFRLIQSVSFSIPLILLNLVILLNSFQNHDLKNSELNISLFKAHISQVQIHGLSFLFSFLNLLRSSSSFNERETKTLLFTFSSFPFLFFTILTRLVSLSLILAFMNKEWILLFGFLALLLNCLVYSVSLYQRKTFGVFSFSESKVSDESSKSLRTKKCSKFLIRDFLTLFALSLISIVIPSGYSADKDSKHPRIRGSVFLLLNYFVNSLLIGITCGLTIYYFLPNDIHGLELSNPSITVQVPGSKIFVKAVGLDVSLNLPKSDLNMGSMPALVANVNIDNIDFLLASLLPSLLAFLSLPFVFMRALTLGLNVYLIRHQSIQNEARDNEFLLTLVQSKNKCKIYFFNSCSILGMIIFTVTLLLLITVLVLCY